MATSSPGVVAQDNQSYIKVLGELGKDCDLLRYLPYTRATFQPQSELDGAGPERLLYGDMMDEKDQLWIYFTLIGGGDNYNKGNGPNHMLTFITLKNAHSGGPSIELSRVKEEALASQPFKYARDQFQIMAIAKFFFIKRGIDALLRKPISSKSFKGPLLSACRDYEFMFKQQDEAKKASTATHNFYHGTTSRELSHAASSLRSPGVSRASPLVSLSQTLDVDHSRKRMRLSSPGIDDRRQATPSALTIGNQQDLIQSSRSLTVDSRDRYSPAYEEERDTMVNNYIAFQAKEEELDRQIIDAEAERSDVTAQMVALQAHLDETSGKKARLMAEKEKVNAEKQLLQDSLDPYKMLEIGFDAGKKWESQRQRRE